MDIMSTLRTPPRPRSHGHVRAFLQVSALAEGGPGRRRGWAGWTWTPADAAHDADAARLAAMRADSDAALRRGILPPGDARNALTIGAIHADGLGEIAVPDTVWDIAHPNGPARTPTVRVQVLCARRD